MTDTLQQVADDLASHIGEMRVVMDEMAAALKPFAKSAIKDWDEDAPDDTEVWSSQGPGWPAQKDSFDVGDLRTARSALSAYERVRKLYSIETAPTEVRKQAGDVS